MRLFFTAFLFCVLTCGADEFSPGFVTKRSAEELYFNTAGDQAAYVGFEEQLDSYTATQQVWATDHGIYWGDASGNKHELNGEYTTSAVLSAPSNTQTSTDFIRLNGVFTNAIFGGFTISTNNRLQYIADDTHVFSARLGGTVSADSPGTTFYYMLQKNGTNINPVGAPAPYVLMKTAGEGYEFGTRSFVTRLQTGDEVEWVIKTDNSALITFQTGDTTIMRFE